MPFFLAFCKYELMQRCSIYSFNFLLICSQDMITDHLVEPYEDSLDELTKQFDA
jgi:hypothetical protein